MLFPDPELIEQVGDDKWRDNGWRGESVTEYLAYYLTKWSVIKSTIPSFDRCLQTSHRLFLRKYIYQILHILSIFKLSSFIFSAP